MAEAIRLQTALGKERDQVVRVERERDRLRAAREAVRTVLRTWNRSAWDGNDIGEDDTPSAGWIVDDALKEKAGE